MPRKMDWEQVKALADKLAAGPMTLGQIQEHSHVSWRTAYRWLDELERRGYDVVRRRRPDGVRTFEVLDVPA